MCKISRKIIVPSYRIDVRTKWEGLEHGLAHSKCSINVMLNNSLHKIKKKTYADYIDRCSKGI